MMPLVSAKHFHLFSTFSVFMFLSFAEDRFRTEALHSRKEQAKVNVAWLLGQRGSKNKLFVLSVSASNQFKSAQGGSHDPLVVHYIASA